MTGSTVVSLQISKESQAPSRVGFGRSLVLATNTPSDYGSDKIKAFTGDTDGKAAVTAQFGSGSEEEAWANDIISQNVKPDIFYIGIPTGSATAWVKTITNDTVVETGDEITVNINGVEVVQAFDTDNDTTMDALATKLQAATTPGVATAVASDEGLGSKDTITITADSGWPLNIDSVVITGSTVPGVTIATTTTGRTAYDDISDLVTLSRDWYALATLSRDTGHLLECARAIQAADRMFFGVNGDADAYDGSKTTDIFARLKALTYDRSAMIYHDKASQHIDAQVLGLFLPQPVGSKIFTNRPLVGSTQADITTTQEAALVAKNANYYGDVHGRSWFLDGKTADGGFVDTRLRIDYMYVNMLNDILDKLESGVEPYTQGGIDAILRTIRKSLQGFATTVGSRKAIIRPDFTVPAINLADIAAAKKDNRILPDITFTANLQGAIQRVEVAGVVSV